MNKQQLIAAFADKFGPMTNDKCQMTNPAVYASPGRINLIGEHTDYNGGFVFPGAVQQGIMAVVAAYTLLNIVWIIVWQVFAKRLIGVRLWDVCKDTLPFALISAMVMAAVWYATTAIGNTYLLLLVRIVMAVVLYAAIMKLLRVKMMDDCIQFFKGKKIKE
jgi:hypothetical protein